MLKSQTIPSSPSSGELTGWRPIESAPRDGTRIIIYRPAGRWPVCEAWWVRPYEKAPEDQCWWQGGDYRYLPEEATYWQPSPEPPK